LAVIPPSFRERGLLWMIAQLTQFLMRPNPTLSRDLAAIKQHLKWDWFKQHTGIVGVHVRRGDACIHDARKGRVCSPLSEYMKHVLLMKKKYGVSAMFIASDSKAAIDQVSSEQDCIRLTNTMHHSGELCE
jgi:hypothetical protein